MTIERYTITVGNNTSVTGTSYKLDDAQLKQLEALVKSGDILLDPSKGVITVKTAKGLVSAGAIAGVSVDELMEIDDLPAEIFRGMTHESAMAAINRFSTTDPKEMSLSELMSYMFMLIYQSESDRREALQTAKGKQLLIQMQQAAMQWAQSREAAEKEYANALTSAIGQIVGGAISAGMSVGGAVAQTKANKLQKKFDANKAEIKKAELAQKYSSIRNERDANNVALKTRAEEKAQANANAIKEKEIEIKENQRKITNNDIIANDENCAKSVKDFYKNANEKHGQEKTKLESEIRSLVEDNQKLGYDGNGKPIEDSNLDYGNSSIASDSKYQDKVKSDVKLAECEAEIKSLGGTITGENGNWTIRDSGGVQFGNDSSGDPINIALLKKENDDLEPKIKNLSTAANVFQSSSVVGQIAAGGFQIGAAHHAKDAAFLDAESKLTAAFQNFASSQVQSIDSSAEQALRQLGALISSLKEVFRAMYDIECSMARNI